MKKTALLLVLLLLPLPLVAQQATLTTPETYTISATKIVTKSVSITADSVALTFDLLANDGTVKRTAAYTYTDAASVTSFVTAIGTTRAGETGTVLRRFNFRVIGWMADRNNFTDQAGNAIAVTAVP